MASFVVVLPVEPVTPTTVFPHSLLTAAAKACNAASVSSTAIRPVFTGIARQHVLAYHGCHRARLQGRFDKVVAVHALARDGKKQLARRHGARIDRVAASHKIAVKLAGNSLHKLPFDADANGNLLGWLARPLHELPHA